MADAYIGSSGTTVPLPLNYVHRPTKFEDRTRALDGSMLINYAVTTGNVAVTKYHFELPGITKSERLNVRAEALKIGNMSYIDHITIPEVFIHSGSTSAGSIDLQRQLGSNSSSDITGTLAGDTKTITISTGVNPTSTGIFVTMEGALTVGSTSTGNLIIDYIPSYTVHIVSDDHVLMQKSSTGAHIVRYNLVLEEV